MKFSGVGVLSVLVTATAAKRGCGRPPSSTLVTSTASPIPVSSGAVSASSSVLSSSALSSSIPSSSILSSSVLSSSVLSSSVLSSSVLSTSVLSSSVLISSAPSSSVLSSSTPARSSAPLSSSEPACGGGQCLAAITIEPTIGDVFCSSWLSQTPETTIVTETATVTSTHTNLATVSTVLTLTTATTTKISGTTLVFLKRAPVSSFAPDPSAAILSQCLYASSRVSSACSCHLSTTSTMTITETATETLVPEYTTTIVETATTQVIATEEAQATTTIPAQPIVNSGLESYITTGNISPWVISSNGGTVQIIDGVNPCIAGGVCAGGRVVIRVYPPTAGGYTSIKETFTAKPSKTYSASFMYRCLNYNSNVKIEAYYKGQFIGRATTCMNSAAFELVPQGAMPFTTDSTGVGEIEFRFYNPGNLPYLYFYADKFEATLM